MPQKQNKEQNPKLDRLIDIFIEKNSQVNLSSIRDREGIQEKHIDDSLAVMQFIKFSPDELILDLGTGGGFPGLPLAIENPQSRFILLDATKKKIEAINDFIKELDITNASTIWGRAEYLKHIEFDSIVARAVMFLPKLLELTKPMLKKRGRLLVYKLPNNDELMLGKKEGEKINMKMTNQYNYKIGDQVRVIWEFERGN